MLEFDEDVDDLFKTQETKKKGPTITKTDKLLQEKLRKKGAQDVEHQEERIRIVYYSSLLHINQNPDSTYLSTIFKAHHNEDDFLTSTSMSSELGQAKQVLFNFVTSAGTL